MQERAAISLITLCYLLTLARAEVIIKTSNLLHKIVLLISCVPFGFCALSTADAASGIIRFQEESGTQQEYSSLLIGHWRKTTIGYVGPRDEHLVLHPDGTAENWIVTAQSRGQPVTGRWSVEGKTLTLVIGDNENSRPFTFYQGQLVFPNIPNRRGFWEKIQ